MLEFFDIQIGMRELTARRNNQNAFTITIHRTPLYCPSMNLQQIRYVREIARHKLNLSAAAEALHTSQPGVSRQVRELESELGVEIFVRQGKRLTALTPAGVNVLEIAERLWAEVENIKRVGLPTWDADDQTLARSLQRTSTCPPFQRRFGNPMGIAASLLICSSDSQTTRHWRCA